MRSGARQRGGWRARRRGHAYGRSGCAGAAYFRHGVSRAVSRGCALWGSHYRSPYAELSRKDFDRVLEFVATGGYALKSYDRYARLRGEKDGSHRLSHPRLATRYRMNVGTIVEAPMLKLRLTRPPKAGSKRPPSGGRVLGEMEEYFLTSLAPGDTFVFAGETLGLESVRDTEAYVSRATHADPKVPTYQGGRFPISTHLAERVRHMLTTPETWHKLPRQVADWLMMQKDFLLCPALIICWSRVLLVVRDII